MTDSTEDFVRRGAVIHARAETGDLLVPNSRSVQAKAAEEGSSSAMGERAGQT
jgi:hypothetical protein